MELNKHVYRISVIILIIIYGVGLIGFLTIYKDLMIGLTPFTLLLSLVLLLINQQEWNRFVILFIFSIMAGGFAVEVIGVETGMLFGHYSYGDTLGIRLLNVPLLIGVNWFILVFSSGMISRLLKVNRFWRALFAASLMVALDVSLEPVAIAFDFWSWENNIIPLQNYVLWFIVSLIFHWAFQSLNFKRINRFAVILFIVQWVFFMVLSFTINFQ
ncbi:MAG: carotenoid biosynthesis protein [Cyclobacteriaceae bacterium]|nr:carotenoid biosynthesis protein [Cyclobacteriaceae bacterium]